MTVEIDKAIAAYTRRGWAVFPVEGKRPLVRWRDASTAKTEQARALFDAHRGVGIAVDCGKSALVVFDLDVGGEKDGARAWRQLKAELGFDDDGALVSRTGGGGYHVIFSDPTDGLIGNADRNLPDGIDVRGSGGYIVAPPSQHPDTGKCYRWERSEGEPSPVPSSLVRLLLERPEDEVPPKRREVGDAALSEAPRARAWAEGALRDEVGAVTRTPKGNRNNRLNEGAFALGQIVGADILEYDIVYDELIRAAVTAGLGRSEARKTVESGLAAGMEQPRYPPERPANPPAGRQATVGEGQGKGEGETEEGNDDGGGGRKRTPMKDKILQLALSKPIELFTDQHGTPFCRVPRDGHFEILRIAGERFGDWLGWLLYIADGRTCSDQTMEPARRILRAKAKFQGQQYKLSNRVAQQGGVIFYDLTDPDWRAVKITPEGWEIDREPPILFRRYTHQQPQVKPARVTAGDAPGVLESIFDFVNLQDRGARLLFQVNLVSLLIPDIAHPVVPLHGEQGSGKTYTQKVVKRLVDPSSVQTLAVPWKSDEFVQQLAHHHVAVYDNLTGLADWQQDIVCRAVTGEGHTKRALYSDDEDIVYSYRRCIGFNGINLVSTRPDLLDRALIFELEPLEDRRRTETELWKAFDSMHSQLLGAMFTLIARAMQMDAHTATGFGRFFRLADWASWGWRVAEALGGRGNEFISLYDKAVHEKSAQALELHPLGRAVQVFMSNQAEWAGTAQDLLSELESVAEVEGIQCDPPFPGSASWVGRRLKEVRPDLRATGITYSVARDANQRTYTLQNDEICDGNDKNDSISL